MRRRAGKRSRVSGSSGVAWRKTRLLRMETSSCTEAGGRAMRPRPSGSGLEFDFHEDHLAAARVEDFVLDTGWPRVTDAAREIGESFLAVRHHAQAAGGHRHDHVVVLVTMGAGGGTRRQAIAGDPRPWRVDLAVDLRLHRQMFIPYAPPPSGCPRHAGAPAILPGAA